MYILQFILSLFYFWVFIEIVFRDVVLSTDTQALTTILLSLAFLVIGIKEIENKTK